MDNDGQADASELVDLLRNATFPQTRIRPGYNIGDVDAFPGKIAEALNRGEQVDPELIHRVQFGTTRLRPGYDEEVVDAFLDKVEGAIRRNAL